MAAWVGRRRQIQDQQRPEHWFVAAKPIVATAAGSTLAVESRAAPTTVHELQPAAHQSVTSWSSAVPNNRRVVVVSNGSDSSSKKSGGGSGGSSEYQLQFAWPTVHKSIKKMPESLDGVFQQGQQHHHHHQHQQSNNNGTEREAAGLSSSNRGREEMYLRQYGGNMVSNNKQQQQQLECEGGGGEAGGEQQQQQPASRRRRYKTEYKKNFRPFSLYQYVDGQFCKASSGATAGGEGGGGSADHQQQQLQQQLQQSEKGDPWYHEVLELRKKAGEYKFRGLGGELMPQHMVDLYAKQMDVWEQVSRRSSLSALSLAATTPRSASSEKASAANTRRSSPAKTVPQSARPGHAQPLLSSNSRKENTSSTRSQVNNQSAERPRRELSQQRSISADGKTRAKSAKPSKSSSTGANAPNVQVAIRPSLGAIFHPANKTSTRSASVGPERRVPKSNSSAASTVRSTAPVKGRHNNNTNDGANEVAVKPVPKNVNNKKSTADEIKDNQVTMMTTNDDKGQEEVTGPVSLPMEIIPAVTAEDEEPLPALIKAAPEPTRVKSPEQLLVRSPEPVNWTVPLDTAKTFTVTQNIRGGDGGGSRPHSELKVSMMVRPSPTPPPVVHQANNNSSSETDNGPTMPVSDVNGASPPPIPATATVTAATRPVKAPDGEEEKREEEEKEDESLPVEPEPIVDERMMEEPAGAAIPPSVDDIQPIVRNREESNCDPLSVTEIQSNGLASAATITADPLSAMAVAKEPEAEKSTADAADATAVTTVPGTTLRCLEDPTPFLFSRPATLITSPPASTSAPSVPAAVPKAPRYRVLEDPTLFQADASFSPSVAQPYKVLEAPSSPKGTAAVSSPGSSSPSSNRTIASDVLEKARTRFDRFWTKKEGEK